MKLYRQILFSSKKEKEEKDKKEDKKSKAAGIALLGAGLGSGVAARKLNSAAWKKTLKGVEKSSKDTEENRKLREKLLDTARSQGTNTISDDTFDNSAYLGTPIARKLRERAEKSGTLKEFQDLSSKRYGSKVVGENIGKDVIVIGNGYGKSPGVIAHEMGHGAMSTKERSKDIIGKASHSRIGKTLDIPRGLLIDNKDSDDKNLRRAHKMMKSALILGGMGHGMKYEEKKDKGDKKGARKEIAKGLGIGSLISAPQLISEAAASRKGLKYLRESGANKEQMKDARKTLGAAFGTYASTSLIPVGLEATGMGLGIGASKLIKKLDKKKKSKKEKDEEKSEDNKKD